MKRAFVSSDTKSATISWFPGSSSESIEAALKHSLEIPLDTEIRVSEPLNGCLIALNEFVPNGLKLHVDYDRPKESENDALLPDFRGQLLKFERINAHLANERTWLAWVRTALSLVSCSFTLWDQATSNSSWRTTYFVVGCLFVACVDLTWFTGYSRYRTIKDVLALPKDAVPANFNRIRLSYQAIFLGLLLLAILIIYVVSGYQQFDDL